MRRLLSLIALSIAWSCAHRSAVDQEQPSVEAIASDPHAWDGRNVEIRGLVVWEVHNVGFYRSYRDYCRGRSLRRRTAIYVHWQDAADVQTSDNRRMAIVAGTFRNRTMVPLPDGTITISTGAPGPGPLEDARIVGWLSEPLPPCSR